MAVSASRTKDVSSTSSRNVIYPPPNDVKLTSEDRPATTASIQLQIMTDNNTMLLENIENNSSSRSDIDDKWPGFSNINAKPDIIQFKSDQVVQKQFNTSPNKECEIDAILARKISSMDLNKSARSKHKLSVIAAVEEVPQWRDIGEYEVLRRTKCRRLYSRLGKSKDLALFYRSGKFYAMEAWCSHMGGPLFEGDIEDHKGTCHVMCPWHAYMFELTTGRSDIGLKQQVFPVKCEDGHVFIEYTSPLALYPYL